ncbi:hypothetical protein [Nocardia sp. NPDC004711]
MAGNRLDELRAERARIYAEMDAILADDPDTDTAAQEQRVFELDEQIGAILDFLGAEEQEKIRQRQQSTPRSAPPDRLF